MRQRRITYLSGIANNLYRRLGYMEDLRGRRLTYLHTGDDEMAVIAAADPAGRWSGSPRRPGTFGSARSLPVWPPPTLRGRADGWLHGRTRPRETWAAC